MEIVGVTACISGVAHTYMAAEALEKLGKKSGHKVTVETQGALGSENQLTEAQIAAADVAVIIQISISKPLIALKILGLCAAPSLTFYVTLKR